MDKNSPEWIVLNYLCEVFDEHGSKKRLSIDGIHQSISAKGVSRGETEVAISRIHNYVDSQHSFDGFSSYAASTDGFDFWSTQKKKSITPDSSDKNDDKWQALKIENYKEVAEKTREMADQLSSENGYVASHPLEAEYTIEASRNFADSLEKNEGKTLKQRLEYLLSLLERVLTIFDKLTRLGKIISDFTTYLTSL